MKKLSGIILVLILLAALFATASAEIEESTVCPGKTISFKMTHRTRSTSADPKKYGWEITTIYGEKGFVSYELYQPTLSSYYDYQSGVLVGVDNYLVLGVTGGDSEGQIHFIITYDGAEIGNYLVTVGHQWGEWETVRPATASDDGLRQRKCSVCEVVEEAPARISVEKIKLSQTKATLTRTGKQLSPTLQLEATVTPDDATNKAVTWTSSNAKVAKVDKNGKVTALKEGTVTITCKAKDGSGKEASCKITVKDTKVSKITLNKTKATMKAGKTLQLKVKKFTPASPVNQKVKWSTSNKKVATVDKNGKVKAKSAGTCKITCSSVENPKKKVTCTITVK